MDEKPEIAGANGGDTLPPMKAGARHSRRLKRRHYLARAVLVLLFLVGVYFSVVPQGRAAARAVLLLPALVMAAQPVPLVVAGEPVRHTQRTVDSAGGPVFLDIYEPATPPPLLPGAREGVVIIPGVGDERREPQLVNLSEALARSGLVVADMTTPTLLRYDLSPVDTDGVVRAVQALQRWPGVGADRVGILGFSAGGSLGSLAAVDPRIRDSLAFITIFGGYYDATTLLRTFGRRALEVHGKLQPWEPNPVPVQVLANVIADTLPVDDGANLVQALSPGGTPLSDADLATMSPAAAAAYHLLAGDDPAHVEQNLQALSPEMQSLLTALSPSSIVARLRAPVYLLHDRNDPFVPYTESRDFHDALTKLGRPHDFVEFSIFQHVEVKTGLGLGPLLGDGLALFRLLSELLMPAS